jgi:hypothetical protein
MKKILLSFTLIVCSVCFTKSVNAQCDLEFPNLARAFSTDITQLGPNKCQYTISVSFDIVTNSGFKYLFFHSWLEADYPNPSIFDCTGNTPATDPGTSVQLGTAIDELGKSFNDLGFVNLNDLDFAPDVPVDVTANIATEYPNDPSVVLNSPLNSPGMTATITRRGSSDTLHFDITNLRVIVNTPCGTPVVIKTDIWGSNQNAPDPKAQCYICGVTQSFGDPTIALRKICTVAPFQYTIGVTTVRTADLHIVYRIYADDLDGIREPGGDDSLLFTSDTVVINSSDPFNSGLVNLPAPYCCLEPFSQWGIFAEVTAREFDNTISSPVIEEICAAVLPVTLRSFNAVRNNTNVLLKWETEIEENNRGFYLEKNSGNNNWKSIGFVATKAMNGNSNSRLSYDYSDINDLKGVTQYRLRQIDRDGKQYYSQIRSVRGIGQKTKTIIYPNPSSDGKVNVIFEDRDVSRHVSLMDMNGRVVRQWKNVLTNTLQIENLVTGFYTVRIINTETGEQTVEKLVVKSR